MTQAEAWARAFALTLAVELAIATPLLGTTQARLGRRLAVVTLAQLASHPLVWFVLPDLRLPRTAFLLLAESWAVASEIAVYRLALGAAWSRGAAASLIANGASLAASLVLRGLMVAV